MGRGADSELVGLPSKSEAALKTLEVLSNGCIYKIMIPNWWEWVRDRDGTVLSMLSALNNNWKRLQLHQHLAPCSLHHNNNINNNAQSQSQSLPLLLLGLCSAICISIPTSFSLLHFLPRESLTATIRICSFCFLFFVIIELK